MAIGKASDFVVYQEQFNSGATEIMMQNAQVFNEASNGTILLSTKGHKGDYSQEAFFQEKTLVGRRDTTSTAAATVIALTQTEDVKVKLNRIIGPVDQTLDSWRKIARDPGEMSFIVGQQYGKEIMLDYINTAVAAADNAFAQDLTYDGSAATINHAALVQGLSAFGDRGQDVAAFVMHSKVYYDLVGQSIADKITNVAGNTIHSGTAATLGRPVIISDISGLINTSPTPDEYHTLALMKGAISIEESEDRMVVSELVTGLDNLVGRIQGEGAWTLGLKGYAWDITNGGANPTAGSLNTATNWDKIVTDDKSIGGAQIVSQ